MEDNAGNFWTVKNMENNTGQEGYGGQGRTLLDSPEHGGQLSDSAVYGGQRRTLLYSAEHGGQLSDSAEYEGQCRTLLDNVEYEKMEDNAGQYRICRTVCNSSTELCLPSL